MIHERMLRASVSSIALCINSKEREGKVQTESPMRNGHGYGLVP